MEAQYEWQLKATPTDQDLQAIMAVEALPKAAAQLLWQRGIKTPEAISAFMHPNVGQLHDPYALYDMQTAVDRIQAAVMGGEKKLQSTAITMPMGLQVPL